jgi:hypothetical protein
MSAELSLLLGSIAGGTGALLSFWAGWRARGDVMRIRGGVIGRPPLIFNECRTIRGNRRGSNPASPRNKPEPPPSPPLARARNPFVSEFQQQINDYLGMTEGPVQRGNRNGGPTTPKPEIVPKPQPPGPTDRPWWRPHQLPAPVPTHLHASHDLPTTA